MEPKSEAQPPRHLRRTRAAVQRWRLWSRRHPFITWPLRLGIAIIVALGLAATPIACTTRVVVPAVTGERATVLLVDHGRTPSLVLPRSEGGHDRWVYGDWGWYALGRTSLLRAPAVLFWPTQGALGRQQFDGSMELQEVRAQLQAEKVYRIDVAADDARALQQELTALFDRRRDTLVQQVGGPLSFVHHSKSYTWFGNSNHMTARWLRALGCEVRGPAFYSRWTVTSADEPEVPR